MWYADVVPVFILHTKELLYKTNFLNYSLRELDLRHLYKFNVFTSNSPGLIPTLKT
jgi:hypothetical protein